MAKWFRKEVNSGGYGGWRRGTVEEGDGSRRAKGTRGARAPGVGIPNRPGPLTGSDKTQRQRDEWW